jgi:hypothetical protein
MNGIKVFIPEERDANVFFDEIIENSSSDFVFGKIKDYKTVYDIVLIHWPEKLFDWKMPSKDDLEQLEQTLDKWKKCSKIVYVFHDYYTHYDKNGIFNELHELIHRTVNAVNHLGDYSLKNHESIFSNDALQTKIYHPLYLKQLNDAEKHEQSEVSKDDVTMLVVGNIRSNQERKLIVDAFKSIDLKDKILVVPRMFYSISKPKCLPHRFAPYYRKWIKTFFRLRLGRAKCKLGDTFISNEGLVKYLKSNSFLFIPRLKSLNSGNLYLGITFKKLIVVPKIGNLTEISETINYPAFFINNQKDLKIKMNEVIKLMDNYNFKNAAFSNLYEELKPEQIALQYDDFFKEILSN